MKFKFILKRKKSLMFMVKYLSDWYLLVLALLIRVISEMRDV
jgi:hypothetical protein